MLFPDAAVRMKATGWQQHSVRGFLAGVIRKRLKLELDSAKVDGTRVYRLVGGTASKAASRQPTLARADRHGEGQDRFGSAEPSDTRRRDSAIARSPTSLSFEAVGITYLGGVLPLPCPATWCFAF
jgi:hypothetical protein